MTSKLHKRLERLEALLAARVSPPIWRFVMPGIDEAAELEQMVANGEVAERDKGRVQFFRWLTREEALARGMEVIDSPPEHFDPVSCQWVRDDLEPRQLSAPPELKLLPPPTQPQTEPPPQVQAKRALTEDQLGKLLEDRERPFGRPIKYPKGMATP